MPTNPTKSTTTVIASDTHLIAGLQKHKADLPPSISLVGQTLTSDELVTILQTRIAVASAVPPAKAAYAKAVAARTAEREATDELVRDLKTYLIITNKKAPDVLSDYGLEVIKPAVPSTATKVVAIAKRKQTRTLRGTKGPKAKKAIKAVFTGTVMVGAGGATATSGTPSK